jgi:hypothetical protein
MSILSIHNFQTSIRVFVTMVSLRLWRLGKPYSCPSWCHELFVYRRLSSISITLNVAVIEARCGDNRLYSALRSYKSTGGSRGSSVSIVSDYGLDDRVIGVRSPTKAKGFFLQPLC